MEVELRQSDVEDACPWLPSLLRASANTANMMELAMACVKDP